MSAITCIDDLRQLARRRVPRMFSDYMESGSWTESTVQRNLSDLSKLAFRQRVAVNLEQRSLRSTMSGQEVEMPVALAPTGLAGMQHADGEILAARAAQKFGIPFTLSTMSICSIEDIATHTTAPFWFQLYVMKDRAFVERLLARARAAACPVLVLTLDVQVFGQRHKDVKNGLAVPLRPSLPTVLDLLSKPRWCMRMLGTPRRGFGNIVGHAQGVSDMSSLAAWTTEQFDASLTWADVAWVRERWPGKLVVKGIMDADDARQAMEHGADAVVVSNHGGRQLDGTISSIAALPAIVDAVGARLEVQLDSGIRSGQDVLRALALGAKGVYIGRPFLYGLGALGEEGVSKCLQMIRKELDLTMAMCGLRDVTQAGPGILVGEPGAARV